MARLILELTGRAPADATLIGFPPIGSGTEYFHDWVRLIPAGTSLMAVRLPGRQDLWNEDPLQDMADIVSEVGGEIVSLQARCGVTLLGICGTGLMAYAVAQDLTARGHLDVRALILNNTPLPTTASMGLSRTPSGRPALLSDAESTVLRESFKVEEKFGLGAALSSSDDKMGALLDEVWELAEPRIRADTRAIETFTYDLSPLDVPIFSVHSAPGRGDSFWEAQRWRPYTRAHFIFRHLEERVAGAEVATAHLAREIIAMIPGSSVPA